MIKLFVGSSNEILVFITIMVRLKKDSRIVVIFIGSVSSKLDTQSSGRAGTAPIF